MHVNTVFLFTILVTQCKSLSNDIVGKVTVVPKKDGEKSSLVFVFDTTGSMYDDLRQLREGAELILNAALEESSNIEDFVFVPFHDPAVGPATVTQNKSVFKNALNVINVYGGLDCPEMSLGGILLALNSSRPKSQVYVFSDATAKDYNKLPEVLDKLQQTQSQVVFVLTGHCHDLKKPSYQAYQKIAAASSGQVFNLNKTSVHNVLDFVKKSLKGRHVNLGASINTAGYNHTQKIPIDNTLGEVTVSVSGVKPKIRVVDPHGKELTGPPKLVKALDLSEIMIVKVLQPEPGNWSITVGSENEHSVKVVGLSNLTFHHGFSVASPQDIEETSYRPLQGTYNHLLVQLTGPTSHVDLKYADIINLDGRTLFEVPFHIFDKTQNVYIADAFVPPDEMFYISVNGVDKNGQELRRIGSTAIQSKLPDAPLLTSPTEIRARPYESVVLKCNIESMVPVTGMWMQYDRRIQEQISSLQSTSIKYSISNMSEMNSGTYTCFAKNVAGVTTKDTELILIVDPPKVSISPENLTILTGSHVIISCTVISGGILNKFQLIFEGIQQYATDIKIIPSLNGVYTYNKTIERVTEANQGTYTCLATNKGGESSNSTHLSIQSKPTVQILGPHTITQLTHTLAQIVCKLDHAEMVIWKERDREIRKERVNDSFMSVLDFNVTEDTVVTCVGVRGDNEASDSLTISSLIKPLVRIVGSKKIIILRGESKQVMCDVTAKPPPRIVWHKETEAFLNHEVLTLSPTQFRSIITLNSTGDLRNKTYFCIGENSEGIGEDSIDVVFKGKMELVQGFSDQIVEIYSQVELQCLVNSYPVPEITWYHNGTVLNKDVTRNTTVLQLSRVDFNNTGQYACEARNGYEVLRVNGTLSLGGLEAPVLRKNLITKTVREGASTIFTCRVLKGVPPPILKWSFNNSLVPDTLILNTSEIFLQNITKQHQGVYKCEAYNIIGRDEYEVTLIVQYLSVGEGNKMQVKTGEKLVLDCEEGGNPRPHVVWYYGGLPMVYNKNKYLSNDNDLTILNITEYDTGLYSCVATNIIGKKQRNITIQVYEVPSILPVKINPQIDTLEGQFVELPCQTSGIPAPDVTWIHNGNAIDNNRMDLDEYGIRFVANLTDFGIYNCLVKNEFGNVSKSYDLRVWVPPSIEPPLKTSVNALIGTNVKLNCDVIGFPIPIVLWEFKGVILTKNTSTISFNEVGNLFISNTNYSHDGLYTCVAKNIAGTATKYINLNIQEAPRVADNFTETYLATDLENTIVIPCTVTGKPRPYVLWSKDDIYLNSDDQYKISSEGTLTITQPTEKLSGQYTCLAKNIHGTVNKTVLLQVFSLPKNIQSEQTRTVIKVIEGTNISLSCPSKTSHDTVKWYKDARLISIGNLNITNISRYNATTFACVRNNAVYSTFDWVDLIVEWPPKFKEENNIIEVVRGEDLYLDCDNDAKPLPRIKWYYNSSLIQGEDKIKYKLTAIQSKHAGVYKCTATNEHGTVTKQFHIQVLVPPFLSEFDLLDVELKEGSEASLQCSPRGYPQPTVKWTFTNNNWTQINNSLSAHINLNSEGIFRCDATNKAGRTHIVYRLKVISDAKITDLIIFVNGKSHIVQLKTDVEVGSHVRFACYASGRPLPKIQWLKNGAIIGENQLLNANGTSDEAISYADFVINSIESKNSGEYVCMTFNEGGVDEKKMMLNVLEPPQIIKNIYSSNQMTNFTKIEVILGQMFYLHCHPIGNPPPSLYWFKDGVPLRLFDDRMISSEFGEVLTSPKALVEQAGNYTCVARNEVGNTSVVYIVDVLVPPPTLKDNYRTITGRVSNTLTLSCPVEGLPIPTVTWIKLPYLELKDTDRIKIIEDNYTLIIRNPQTKDNGNYSCIMTNKVGTNEFIFNVIFEKAPSIVGNVGEINTEIHVVPWKRSVVLKCDVDGYPIPKITWLKDTQPISETSSHIQRIQTSSVYVIWSVDISHAAHYICVAENTAGVDHRRFHVKVKVPGKYGPWSSWSFCNATCGLGYQHRHRICQYHDENNNTIDNSTNSDRIELDSTTCVGKSEDKRKCKMPPCDEDLYSSHWSGWSRWSKCTVTCGEGTQGRTRICRSRVRCDGDNVQIRKCPDLVPCHVMTSEENSDENELYSNWTNDGDQYIPEATIEMQPEVDYVSPDTEQYTPTISKFYDASIIYNLDGSEQDICDMGYKYNYTTKICDDIDECELSNNECHRTQICLNSPGGYKCGCQPGYTSLGVSQRCLDINECSQGLHSCEFSCVNVAGGYLCACPTHMRLHVDKHHCVIPSAYRKPLHELTSMERLNPDNYT